MRPKVAFASLAKIGTPISNEGANGLLPIVYDLRESLVLRDGSARLQRQRGVCPTG